MGMVIRQSLAVVFMGWDYISLDHFVLYTLFLFRLFAVDTLRQALIPRLWWLRDEDFFDFIKLKFSNPPGRKDLTRFDLMGRKWLRLRSPNTQLGNFINETWALLIPNQFAEWRNFSPQLSWMKSFAKLFISIKALLPYNLRIILELLYCVLVSTSR